MQVFNLKAEQAFNPKKHMERVLGRVGEGDVTIACWEPGQTSPYHCHPNATEIYFCFEGGGTMRTPTALAAVTIWSKGAHGLDPVPRSLWNHHMRTTLAFEFRETSSK